MMNLRYQKGYVLINYYQDEGKNGVIIMKDKKDSVIYLYEFLLDVFIGGVICRQEVFLVIRV